MTTGDGRPVPGDGEASQPRSDWSFSFVGDGETAVPDPPAALVDDLEMAKASLHRHLREMTLAAELLQSVVLRAAGAGMRVDDIAVHAGLSLEAARAVAAGDPIVDALFASAPRG